MCYSRNCRYENYWGECEKPRHKPCPYAQEEDLEKPDSAEEKEKEYEDE